MSERPEKPEGPSRPKTDTALPWTSMTRRVAMMSVSAAKVSFAKAGATKREAAPCRKARRPKRCIVVSIIQLAGQSGRSAANLIPATQPAVESTIRNHLTQVQYMRADIGFNAIDAA